MGLLGKWHGIRQCPASRLKPILALGVCLQSSGVFQHGLVQCRFPGDQVNDRNHMLRRQLVLKTPDRTFPAS